MTSRNNVGNFNDAHVRDVHVTITIHIVSHVLLWVSTHTTSKDPTKSHNVPAKSHLTPGNVLHVIMIPTSCTHPPIFVQSTHMKIYVSSARLEEEVLRMTSDSRYDFCCSHSRKSVQQKKLLDHQLPFAIVANRMNRHFMLHAGFCAI